MGSSRFRFQDLWMIVLMELRTTYKKFLSPCSRETHWTSIWPPRTPYSFYVSSFNSNININLVWMHQHRWLIHCFRITCMWNIWNIGFNPWLDEITLANRGAADLSVLLHVHLAESNITLLTIAEHWGYQ